MEAKSTAFFFSAAFTGGLVLDCPILGSLIHHLAVSGWDTFQGLAQEGQSPVNSPSLPPMGSHSREAVLRRQHMICLLSAMASGSMFPLSQWPQQLKTSPENYLLLYQGMYKALVHTICLACRVSMHLISSQLSGNGFIPFWQVVYLPRLWSLEHHGLAIIY